MRGDVGQEGDVHRFVDEAKRACMRLDALVNNAGIDCTTGVDTLDVADWDAIIHTNLRGPFLLSKFALPLLRETRGDIVNVASGGETRWRGGRLRTPNAIVYDFDFADAASIVLGHARARGAHLRAVSS